MIAVCFILIFVYALAIACLFYGFSKVPVYWHTERVASTKFSIVVPFRNETKNLPALLQSFSKLGYPVDLFEVILVDDASDVKFKTDDFGFNVTIVDNVRTSNSPKKDAINTAIQIAQHPWIITTDADCRVPKNWLQSIDGFIQHTGAEMIVGAVSYDCQRLFLHHFQQLEFAGLQATTVGSFGFGFPFMCNGANFAYTKSIFERLNGFSGNETIASGDDVFLLQKAVAHGPEKVRYLKSDDNVVMTKPENTWRALFYQRVRWASKSGSYEGYFGKLLGLIVFCGNLAWIFLFFSMWRGEISPIEFLCAFILKNGVDYLLAFRGRSFTNHFGYSVVSGLLYPFFSVCVALYSVVGRYEWKGRMFSK